MAKKYRFFFHYHRQKGGASVHFRGKCIQVDDVRGVGIRDFESKHRNRQPHWVVQGFAEKVEVEKGIAIISNESSV